MSRAESRKCLLQESGRDSAFREHSTLNLSGIAPRCCISMFVHRSICILVICLFLPAGVLGQAPEVAPGESIQDFVNRVEARPGIRADQTRSLDMHEAIGLALQKNTDIAVFRMDAEISHYDVVSADGYYDYTSTFSLNSLYEKTPVTSIYGGGGTQGSFDQDEYAADFSLLKYVPWGGGTLQLEFDNSRMTTNASFETLSPQYNTNLSFTYTQPLVRNGSIDSGRYRVTRLKQSNLLSDVQFEMQVIAIVNSVQTTYLDLLGAIQNVRDQEDAVRISYEQLEANREAVRLNLIAAIELRSNESSIETRKGWLVVSVQQLAQMEDTLKALLTRDHSDSIWFARLEPAAFPDRSAATPDVQDAIELALNKRPEVRQQDLQVEQSALDVRFFRNQMTPQVDLVGTASSAALAGTAVPEMLGKVPEQFVGGYGDAFKSMVGWDFPKFELGVLISFPWGNKTASANWAKATLQKQQQEAKREQLMKEIAQEVRNAVQELQSTGILVETSRAGRIAAQRMMEGEVEKYKAGKSTNFLVLQRQDEYFTARSTELAAVVNYQKAQVEFQRATGMILSKNDIDLAATAPSPGR